MGTLFTEGNHAGAYIVSEATVGSTGVSRSRDTGTLIAGQNLSAGTVLGKITASGKYTQLAPAANDGSEVAVAILFDNVDATGADATAVIHTRDMEFNAIEVVMPTGASAGEISTAIGELANNGIIAR